MGLEQTLTLVVAAMLCNLVTSKVVMWLPLSILWGITLEEWVIWAHKIFSGIVGEQQEWHWQKIFLSGRNGSVRVEVLGQRRHRHSGGGLLRVQHQYHASRCISLSNGTFTVSSHSIGFRLKMNTLAVCPTVTIHQNGLIGYVLVLGLQCDGCHSKNLYSRFLYLRTKCNFLFTTYRHCSKLPDPCGD